MINEDISAVESFDDVVSILEKHPELETINDIKTQWPSLYNKFNNLKQKGKIEKDKRLPLPWKIRDQSTYHFYEKDELDTLEKCQAYVDKMGYTSRTKFIQSGDPTIYKIDKLGFSKLLKFKNKRPTYNTGYFDTIEKCQRFVDDHPDITMIDILRDSEDPEYHSVYLSIKNHRWFLDVNFPNRNLGRKDLSYLDSLSAVQKFIDDNEDIHSERDFRTNHLEEYKKAVALGVCQDLIYEYRHRKSKDYTVYSSIDEIQSLINEKGYLSMYEFCKNEHNARRQYYELKKSDPRSLIFKYISTGSSYEDRFVLVLEMYGIPYITQYKFPEFIKNTGCYSYDFYLPEKNVIVEIHGEQHFGTDPNEFVGYFNPIIEQENDKIKHDYAVNVKNIPIRYFTYCKDRYEAFGYFEKVFVDELELLESIGYTNLSIVDNFSSEDNIVLEIQKFIDKYSIKSFDQLNQLNYIFGSRLKAYSLENRVIYREVN